MTDKEYNAQKRRVLAAFKKWAGPTGIGEFIAFHTWHRDGTAGEDEALPETAHSTTARARVAWEYISVNFHWNLLHMVDNTDEEIDRIVRHEIAHVIVNEMRMYGPPTHRDEQARDEAMKHEERVVTKLASILLWCRLKGQAEAKRQSAKRNKKGRS
jgi:hypothetical protein